MNCDFLITIVSGNTLHSRIIPEIYNNIGSLNIRRGDLEGAKKYLNMALEKVRSDIENQQGKK